MRLLVEGHLGYHLQSHPKSSYWWNKLFSKIAHNFPWALGYHWCILKNNAKLYHMTAIKNEYIKVNNFPNWSWYTNFNVIIIWMKIVSFVPIIYTKYFLQTISNATWENSWICRNEKTYFLLMYLNKKKLQTNFSIHFS